LPKDSPEQKKIRSIALQNATKYAIEVPFQIMQTAFACLESIKSMAELGNPNSISDVGVAALCIRTAVMGAYLNVKINCKDLKDEDFVSNFLKEGSVIVEKTILIERDIFKIVNSKI